jgi:putative ABC transport system permease protein
MIRNYLKVAWRNLVKNKAHTFINLAGLSVGLACSLLILLWVQNELEMDAFHKNGKNLYQIYERQNFDHKVTGQYFTPGRLASEMKKVIPEIQYATGATFEERHTFKVGGKIIKLKGGAADADFFKMFSYMLLQGNAQNALNNISGISISEKMARAFFGNAAQAVGKTVRFDDRKDFTVTSVFEDTGANSSLKFDYLINWFAFLQDNDWAKDFGNNGVATYIQLRADANPVLVDKKITHLLEKLDNEKKGIFTQELGLQPFEQVYLHSNFKDGKIEGGRIGYVNLFGIIAVFILLIACINFMNLTTARSVKRAREIGVRKVVGAVKSVLVWQFISESILLTFLAVSVSLILITLLLPVFNQVTQKQIELPFYQSLFWVKLIAITLVTGLISGSYPALFLSSFNPVKVLKGAVKLDAGTTLFRKGLVVFQFVLSVVLIIGTIIVSRQINYIQSINLGYDKENLVYIPIEGNLFKNYDVFKNEALKMPGIKSITRISPGSLTNLIQWTVAVRWDGKGLNENASFAYLSTAYDFIKTADLKMVAGRDFSKDFATDSAGYIINETALKRIGYTDPIGKSITLWGQKGAIIGVVKDFHFNSMHEQIKPLIMRYGENEHGGNMLVRTMPGKTKEAIASLQVLYKQLNPDFQFNYTFSDEEYTKLYNNEQVVGTLSNAFAFLAIFISCLGLLGLAMFTTEQRFKEIGIRKVLGASVASLFALLSAEFIWLVLIALLIATPVAWYAMTYWLRSFAYRTTIEWWMFALSGGLIIGIALITISFQAIKAALINPIRSLRSE